MIPNLTEKQKARFWSKVHIKKPDQCWNWNGTRQQRGYGNISIQYVLYSAHRIAYFLAYGKDPQNLCVCHTCDNPSCVNPSHLWLGTQLDNIRDRHEKGRDADHKGAKHPQAKLTEIQVRRIREHYSQE